MRCRPTRAPYGADVFHGVPFMFEHFVAAPPPGGWPPRLQQLVSAGARLEATTVRRFFDVIGVKIHSFYGTSETGGIAFDGSDEIEDETTVGRPLPGCHGHAAADEGAPEGAGGCTCAGPRSRAATRARSRRTAPFVDGGFLTGDFAPVRRAQPAGTLAGRVSRFVNVAGRKVQPEEVEQVLRAMPGVADVRVLGAPDASRGQQIVACLVADGDATSTCWRCGGSARRGSPPHKMPRTILMLDASR